MLIKSSLTEDLQLAQLLLQSGTVSLSTLLATEYPIETGINARAHTPMMYAARHGKNPDFVCLRKARELLHPQTNLTNAHHLCRPYLRLKLHQLHFRPRLRKLCKRHSVGVTGLLSTAAIQVQFIVGWSSKPQIKRIGFSSSLGSFTSWFPRCKTRM